MAARGVMRKVGMGERGRAVRERLMDVGYDFQDAQKLVRSDAILVASVALFSVLGAGLLLR